MLYDPRIDKRNQRYHRLAKVLDAMAERLGKDEYAWCQKKFMSYHRDKGVGICLVTAVSEETPKGQRRTPIYNALARELPARMIERLDRSAPTTARDRLMFFNDHAGTDAAMVLDLIARARAKVPV